MKAIEKINTEIHILIEDGKTLEKRDDLKPRTKKAERNKILKAIEELRLIKMYLEKGPSIEFVKSEIERKGRYISSIENSKVDFVPKGMNRNSEFATATGIKTHRQQVDMLNKILIYLKNDT